MKTTSSFKLSKRTKTMTALFKFKTQEQRNAFRRMMIDAQATPASFSSKDRK